MDHLLRVLASGIAGLAMAAGGVALPAAADGTTGPTTDATDPTGPTVTDPTGLTNDPVLVDDPSLHVGPDGTVYALDVWPVPAQAAGSAEQAGADQADLTYTDAAASYPEAETFRLHSRRSSEKKIYLDFDGGVVDDASAWTDLRGTSYTGWSVDGSPAFSSSEKGLIQQVWARVAEDFAPFDVDVTTEEPPAGGLVRSSRSDTTYGSRVAFTNSSSVHYTVCQRACGGMAFVATFDVPGLSSEVYGPAWVFPPALGTSNAKALAEAAAHEVGHNLGLSHDATSTQSYYGGTSLWGPIMGAPYRSAVTQWSRGDYVGADNHEDDFAVMQANGITLRPDEAGGSTATAVPLAGAAEGVITGAADQDWFQLGSCDGRLTARAQASPVGPDLDLRLTLLDATGSVVASSAPATTMSIVGLTGMDASVDVPLSGGPFYLAVAGSGSGNSWERGGYDAYGSAGAYRLTASGCGATAPDGLDGSPTDPVADQQPAVTPPGAPARPLVWRGAPGGRLSVGVRWSRPARTGGAPVSGYVLAAYRLDSSGRVLAKRATPVLASGTRSATLVLPRGRWVVKVKARNAAGWGPLSPRSYRVSPR